MEQLILSRYQLELRGDYYIISNEQGRDIFYYRVNSEHQGFPFNISVNLDCYHDLLLHYCFRRLNELHAAGKSMARYLGFFFRRFISYTFSEQFFIDEKNLNREGRFNPVVHQYHLRGFHQLMFRWFNVLKADFPYTENSGADVFDMIKKLSAGHAQLEEDSIEIERNDFEKILVNDDLRSSYVELYQSDNTFTFEIAPQGFPNDKIKEAYSLYHRGILQMVVFIS
jgi:hypothetical protein